MFTSLQASYLHLECVLVGHAMKTEVGKLQDLLLARLQDLTFVVQTQSVICSYTGYGYSCH